MKTDGEQPAFPVVLGDSAYSGMTLRQWYAGMATEADVNEIMEDENLRLYHQYGNDDVGRPLYTPCTRARARFLFANAMLSQEADDDSA